MVIIFAVAFSYFRHVIRTEKPEIVLKVIILKVNVNVTDLSMRTSAPVFSSISVSNRSAPERSGSKNDDLGNKSRVSAHS